MSDSPESLITCSTRGGLLVVSVSADQLTAVRVADDFDEQLKALLDQRTEKLWVMDFQSVTFLVTPAVNALLVVSKTLQSRGGRLALTGLSKNIHQIFSLMRLDELLEICRDVDAAVELLTSKT